MWLIYSLKTNRDWILASDRHLVHWVLYLETNSEVRSFEIEPADDVPHRSAARIGGVDAMAILADGTREYHRLLFSTAADDLSARDIDEGGIAPDPSLRNFFEADLYPRGAEAMRWLKVIGYCAAIRDERQSEATMAAITIMSGLGHGSVLDVITRMPDFDVQIALGVVSRMAVLGDIALNLSSSGFTLASLWVWRRTQ